MDIEDAMNNYINNIGWYLKRPGLYHELFRLVRAKLAGRSAQLNNSEEAILWCKERALETQEAFQRLTGSQASQPVREKFPEVFAVAERSVQNCPFTFGGAGNLDLLYWVSEFIQARNVIETGVAYGWSSLALLLSLANRADSCLISTDLPYRLVDEHHEKLSSEAYVGSAVPGAYQQHWQIIRQADREALPKALHRLKLIDLCHYDSDKTYEGRIWAYPKLWQALRVGGCFISDDIGDNLAFRDFCLKLGIEAMVVRTPGNSTGFIDSEIKYVGILAKK